MKKQIVWCLIMAVVAGCSYGKEHVELMLDNPPGILEDSLYADTRAQLEDLEEQYLNKEISYAEYIDRKQELEDRYVQEADRRTEIVEGN